MKAKERIYLAGHGGMVGSALLRLLKARGFENIVTASHAKLDLCDAKAVRDFLRKNRPETVIVAAAKVGGILANSSYPADFIRENLGIALNLVHESWQMGVKRLLYLGSTCIYPCMAPQPIPEKALLSGPLESTNEAYALAKIAGLKLCQHYRKQYGVAYHSLMPTNLYGPHDNYDPHDSHVLPALIRRFHEASRNGLDRITVWGSGTPRREFLHVEDCARAILHMLDISDPPDWVNVGTGVDVTIRELAETIADVIGYQGEIEFDKSKPDGPPRKLCDSAKLRALGWRPEISLREGLEKTYSCFREEVLNGVARM